jgi:hypothetical protein
MLSRVMVFVVMLLLALMRAYALQVPAFPDAPRRGACVRSAAPPL